VVVEWNRQEINHYSWKTYADFSKLNKIMKKFYRDERWPKIPKPSFPKLIEDFDALKTSLVVYLRQWLKLEQDC